MPSKTFWSAGPPIEVRFAVPMESARISAVFQGVTGSDFGDLLVAIVVDVVRPAQSLALEPGKHRPALVNLGAEVGRELARWHGVEPDHFARVADDFRAAHVATPFRGDEDIAVATICCLRQHGDRRRAISSAGRRAMTSGYGP
jgi:hypothetical protein